MLFRSKTETVAPGTYFDAHNLIQLNRSYIIDQAYNQIGVVYPSFVNPNPAKCKRDLGYIIDAISRDIRDYTNENIISATKSYFSYSGALLQNGLVGELSQSITAFNYARDLMKLAITNNLPSKNLTILADPATSSNISPSSCASKIGRAHV